MSDFPSQKTQPSARALGFLQRHFGTTTAATSLISAALATAAALKLDVDPIKAITQLGLPIGGFICLAFALAWTFAIYQPRKDAQEEDRRRQQHERHIEEIAHLREVMEADRAAAERREERMMKLFEDSLGSILEAHSVTRARVESVETKIDRLNSRFDELATGQFGRKKAGAVG